MGTNSRREQQIFELQTAAIRQGLGDGHSYEWLDGSLSTEMAPGETLILASSFMYLSPRGRHKQESYRSKWGRELVSLHGCNVEAKAGDSSPGMQDLVAPDDEFLMYVDDTPESRRQVLTDMDDFLAMETEPFDGLLAFSLGAGCGASYLIQKMRQGTPTHRLPFRFAVFFCGAPPLSGRPHLETTTMAASSMKPEPIGIQQARKVESGEPSEMIQIPTAHIWGRNDTLWGYGPELSGCCKAENREIVVHDGGHEIPGARDPVTLARCLQAIKRTIARAGGE
ncbi:hypothetical protein AbraIFM66951_010461 [Aspergillus brasiliensis]|uniref:Serine hydrolase domain-containing protein n=1 Tax=Aspergillus brasiliensis TaxID=319629 RepID=A0A9W5YYP8_9EURO|nr:hypothetical protein AbraCBS73388_011261 [Aspergillus brasiliensis]GKZ47112.1 hypothetical protein AbraIFM66951_010461 [Aspergillus brasiliensis]